MGNEGVFEIELGKNVRIIGRAKFDQFVVSHLGIARDPPIIHFSVLNSAKCIGDLVP